MPRKRDSLFLIIAEGLDQSVPDSGGVAWSRTQVPKQIGERGWGARHERARILADAAPELLFHLKRLVDITSQDVFTDATEYSSRVESAEYFTAQAQKLIDKLKKKGVNR